MQRVRFYDLPFVAQLATAASGFMAWVLVEEFEIDRHYLDRFLPLYRYGNLCLYDLAVASLIVGLWYRSWRAGRLAWR